MLLRTKTVLKGDKRSLIAPEERRISELGGRAAPFSEFIPVAEDVDNVSWAQFLFWRSFQNICLRSWELFFRLQSLENGGNSKMSPILSFPCLSSICWIRPAIMKLPSVTGSLRGKSDRNSAGTTMSLLLYMMGENCLTI